MYVSILISRYIIGIFIIRKLTSVNNISKDILLKRNANFAQILNNEKEIWDINVQND